MAYHIKSDLSEALDQQINNSQSEKYYSCGAPFYEARDCAVRSLNCTIECK
jgi:hypothetical protein